MNKFSLQNLKTRLQVGERRSRSRSRRRVYAGANAVNEELGVM